MTNQNNQNQTNTQEVPNQPAENIVAKIGNGFSWWIGSLTGHPKGAKVPQLPQQTTANQQTPQNMPVAPEPAKQKEPSANKVTKNEDSVMQDVMAIKNIVGKITVQVGDKVAPAVKQGVSGASKSAQAFTQKAGPSFITKILRIFLVIVLIIVIIFIAFKLIRKPSGGGMGTPTPEATPAEEVTPTPIIYNPPKSSIYAKDEAILKLEEDINVITREVSSTALRESDLTPPNLDFNVAF